MPEHFVDKSLSLLVVDGHDNEGDHQESAHDTALTLFRHDLSLDIHRLLVHSRGEQVVSIDDIVAQFDLDVHVVVLLWGHSLHLHQSIDLQHLLLQLLFIS